MSAALGALGEGLAELRLDSGSPHPALGFGGDAANICVMAARLGTPARLAGRVGADEFGTRLLDFWRERGVDTSWLRRDPAATGLYLNSRAREGEHRFTYWRSGSAGSRMRPRDVDDAFFDGLGVLVITGITLSVSASSESAAGHAATGAQARGIPVAFVINHRPALAPDRGLLRAWASTSDMLICSTDDAAAVFGTEPLPSPSATGPREVVVTAGAAPATVAWADGSARQDVPRTAIHDAAGAGDALAGSYLAARLAGIEPPEALRRGVAAASLSVGRPGCALSYPDAEETAAAGQRLAASMPA